MSRAKLVEAKRTRGTTTAVYSIPGREQLTLKMHDPDFEPEREDVLMFVASAADDIHRARNAPQKRWRLPRKDWLDALYGCAIGSVLGVSIYCLFKGIAAAIAAFLF